MADTNINLAVVGPYQNLFTYKLRRAEGYNLEPGCRFLVPFGKSIKVGFYIGPQSEPGRHRLRYVEERIDTFSPFPRYLFDFCSWLSDYYFAGTGETLAAALPGTPRRKPKIDYICRDRDFLKRVNSSDKVAYALAETFLRDESLKEEKIAADKDALPIIHDWLERNIIAARYRTREARKKVLGYRIADKTMTADAKPLLLNSEMIYSRQALLTEMGFTDYQIRKLLADRQIEKVLDESGVSDLSTYPIRWELPRLQLMPEQQAALDAINDTIDRKIFNPFLLFGITGSGKTLVYCHAARRAVEKGGSVLVMVPEIALSGLLLSSFAAFFGDKVAVMHSGLTAAERLAVRQKIACGDIRVVIGPRSAIFAPLKNPRLIIVDEEHDPSYKQDDPAPRYHGRDAAVMLAKQLGIPVVLGSASPAIESYHNAVTGRYALLNLTQRPKSGYRMPQLVMLDMKREKIAGECSFLSFQLKKETEQHIAAGDQVIYYLNRRGFSPRLKCSDCGAVPSCPDCGVTLTYHRDGNRLKCHFCDRSEPAPDHCSACNSHRFTYVGVGTQRVEENLARLFGEVRAERIDSDRAASKSGRLILGDFAEEKFDLLLGTQMVTKGLDFPNVTLVGVLSADTGLDMPDFRAAEKAYSKLLQVAGRAGRGDKEGLVMIQTYYDDHPVIRYLLDGDYVNFYDTVIADRESLRYPPFSRLLAITLSCEDEKLLEKEALSFRIRFEEKLAGQKAVIQLTGPAPAPMYKLRGSYRRRFILKCAAITKVVRRLRDWEKEQSNFGLSSKIRAIFDIDPMNMM